MSAEPVVTTSVEVPVDPQEAFRIFTEEYDDWWVRSPTTFHDGARALARRMEPGVGGRVLEVYDGGADDVLELGRITEWEPGRRLAIAKSDSTSLVFLFDGVGAGTRVTLEVRLLPGHPLNESFVGTGRAMLDFFTERASDPTHRSWAERDLPRMMPVLHYPDRGKAGRWLTDTFGVEGWRERAAEQVDDFPIPLRIGDATFIMRGAGDEPVGAGDHAVYVYVDDLDAHFARAQQAGATIVRDIRTYGDRTYVARDVAGHEWIFAQARPTQRGR